MNGWRARGRLSRTQNLTRTRGMARGGPCASSSGQYTVVVCGSHPLKSCRRDVGSRVRQIQRGLPLISRRGKLPATPPRPGIVLHFQWGAFQVFVFRLGLESSESLYCRLAWKSSIVILQVGVEVARLHTLYVGSCWSLRGCCIRSSYWGCLKSSHCALFWLS